MAIFKYKKPNGSGGYTYEEMPVISNIYTEYVVSEVVSPDPQIHLTPSNPTYSHGQQDTFSNVTASIDLLSTTPTYTYNINDRTKTIAFNSTEWKTTMGYGDKFPSAITISIPSSKWLNKDTESSNPPETLTISTKTGTVNISAGYYTTNFAVSLSDTEKNKIIAGNIRSGVTLLGIAGSSNVINTGSSNISSGQSAITASKILSGYSGFINGAEVKGNIASTTGSAQYISTKTGTVTISAGYYSSANTVSISSTEQAKIIADNIRSGVTLLGIVGNSNVINTNSSNISSGQTAASASKILSGYSAFINGTEIKGSYTIPTSTEGSAQYISTKTGTITIPAGTYSSANTVSISSTEQAKIIANNIRSGVTLLGIAGNANVINTNSSNISSGQSAATAAKVLSGYSAFINGAEVKGSYTAPTGIAGTSQTISTKTSTISIPAGYYTSANTVSISSTEQAKIIAGNIRSGVTLLGIAGSSNVINTGSSNISSGQTAASASKILSGYSAFINGAEVKGSYSAPTSTAGTAYTISTKTGTVTISAGTYSSANTVSISSTEQDKIIASNIRSGVTLLGVEGSTYVNYTYFTTNVQAENRHILSGREAWSDGVHRYGSMTDNSNMNNQSLTASSSSFTIPEGYHPGTKTVSIDTTNLSASNIKSGVSILGVTGTYSGSSGGTTILGTGSVNSNITWTVLSNGRLIIEGTGATPDYSNYTGTPWYNASIITEITQIYISNGINTIGTYIFSNLPNVTQINLGNTVHTIKTGAFFNCGSNNYLSIILPASISSIGQSAFGYYNQNNATGQLDQAYIMEVRFMGDYPSNGVSSSAFQGYIYTFYMPVGDTTHSASSMVRGTVGYSHSSWDPQSF